MVIVQRGDGVAREDRGGGWLMAGVLARWRVLLMVAMAGREPSGGCRLRGAGRKLCSVCPADNGDVLGAAIPIGDVVMALSLLRLREL